eukprot:TRINITY_DN24248_c0_g1_i1.p1 TRINITY_DN24248_c0_g1~~TRINITY_DN24248_c0_g1_i1.p1  ORF type:complete len:176 (-),score=54.93 TRINITY_DN24248_c0_g1_i1:171-659(-)
MVLAFMALRGGREFDHGAFDRFYGRMCDDVLAAFKQSAGDMVVTHCVYTRALRELIRQRLSESGASVRVVLLRVSAETVTDRLIGRYVAAAAEKGQSCDEWLAATFPLGETMESLREKTLMQNAVLPEQVDASESATVSVDAGAALQCVLQEVAKAIQETDS